MRTAAAYLRVSTEKRDEYSLDSQLELPSRFQISRLPAGGRKLLENKAKSEPISNPEDMVQIYLLW